MTERTFPIADACRAAGITPSCLHQWIERGQFQPIHKARSGIARAYTLRDIIHIAAIAQLNAAGIPVSRAIRVIGRTPAGTAGQVVVSARDGDVEIHVDLAAIVRRVRSRLTD